MSPSPLDRLKHIRDRCETLLKHVKPLSERQFADDPLALPAAERCFEIIGEATKHLPEEVRGRLPDVEWSKAAKMRDRLAHHYFTTAVSIIYETIQTRVRPLHTDVNRLITEMEKEAAEPAGSSNLSTDPQLPADAGEN